MTRIVAGSAGGRRLTTPAGATTRPTSERVRAALANTLTAAGGLAGARVLDLYAGSGALGLELLSRGAASVVLVERDRAALVAARANVAGLGLPGAGVVAADAAAFARTAVGPFDLVVERATRSGAFGWPAPLRPDRERRYGDTLLCYGRAP